MSADLVICRGGFKKPLLYHARHCLEWVREGRLDGMLQHLAANLSRTRIRDDSVLATALQSVKVSSEALRGLSKRTA